MNHRRLFLIVMLVFFGLEPPVISADWTRFRGPNGSGIGSAARVPIRWTEEDYNWMVKLPGVGHSSPVLWRDRIFLTCSDPRGADGKILCLSTEDGSGVWECGYATKKRVQHADNCFASSTPLVDEKHVYLTWGARDQLVLLALDHNGQQKWRRNLGTFQCGHGSAISPIRRGELVFLANDDRARSFLVAVDRTTGATRWRIERRNGKASYATPCIFKAKNEAEQIIFGSTAEGLAGVDPDTGSVIWQMSELPRNTPTTRWISSPTTAHGLVIAAYAFGNHGLQVIAVRPGSKSKGTAPLLVYTIKTCVPSVPCPLVNGNLLFLCTNDGIVSCHRVLTGERLWSERLGADFYASPVCVHDRLYCTSKDGVVFVLATSETFKLLARNSLGELTYATPAIAGGRMYLRTYSHLMSLGGR